MPQGARGTTKTVDADGNAAFEDLELGLYLIVQSKASNGYGAHQTVPRFPAHGREWEMEL